MNNLHPKYIEEVTFHQIKLITQANLAEKLNSFDKQFSGIAEVIA